MMKQMVDKEVKKKSKQKKKRDLAAKKKIAKKYKRKIRNVREKSAHQNIKPLPAVPAPLVV